MQIFSFYRPSSICNVPSLKALSALMDPISLKPHYTMDPLQVRRSIKQRADNLYNYDEAEECYMTVEGLPVRTLYVSILNADLSKYDLIHVFSAFGKVESVRIVKKTARVSKQTFLYAFLTFSSAKDTAKLLKYMCRFNIKGHRIYYSPADSWHQPKDTSKKPEFDEEVVVAQDPDQCPIFNLNDDCLRLIFDLFPIQERIKLGLVCKRWRSLNQLYWESLTLLNFTAFPFSGVKLTYSKFDSILSLCPNLTQLKVKQENYDSTSNYLISIGKNCKLLQKLTLVDVTLHRRCLAYLAQSCPDLREINFDCVPTLFDHELVYLLKKCTRLDTLKINYEKHLTGRFLGHLRAPLKTLYLSFFDCNDKNGYKGFLNVKETLTSLSILNTGSFTSSQLTFITEHLKNLEHFSVKGSLDPTIETADLIKITKLNKLKSLVFSCVGVEPEFIRQLAQQCPYLESLDMTAVRMTCMGKTLVELTSLKTLKLNNLTYLSDEVLILLSKNLECLEFVSLVRCQKLTDAGVIELIKNCTRLTKLDVSGCEEVTSKTVMISLIFLKDSNRPRITIGASSSGVGQECADNPFLGNMIRVKFNAAYRGQLYYDNEGLIRSAGIF